MSRWLVGSSSRSTSGLPISTLAIETRMRQPPESAAIEPVDLLVVEARGRASTSRARASSS